MSWEEASSICLTALTAYQGLVLDPKRPLAKGQSVFINGGSGGVGLFAIQIARHIVGETGKVVTSCSSRNIEFVKQYGADAAVDYTSVPLPKYLSQHYSDARFDLILDCVGSFDLYNASPHFLSPHGDFVLVGLSVPKGVGGFFRLISQGCAALLLPRFLGGVSRRFVVSVMNVSKVGLTKIGNMVDREEIRPVVDSVWEFNDEGVKGAYSKIMSGHARGKVIVKIF
jgi:reticulon-4-interacting protein 1, mitochondrial